MNLGTGYKAGFGSASNTKMAGLRAELNRAEWYSTHCVILKDSCPAKHGLQSAAGRFGLSEAH